MKLLETAFTYVQRALRGTPAPEAEVEPRPPLPAANSEADSEGRPGIAPLLSSAVEPTVGEPESHDDFADLLSGIGAEAADPSEISDLDRKDREIAELQRNLEMLRPIGDELARVEQLRIAERSEFDARLAELQSATTPRTTPAPQLDLRDVTRLVTALDSELERARASGESDEAPAPAPVDIEAKLARTLEKLANVRRQSAEWKRKADNYRTDGRNLRARLKELRRECSTLRAERKRLHAPVRDLARRAGKRPRAVSRLIELLGLEVG